MKTIKNHVFTALTIILFMTAFLVTACIDAGHEGTPQTKEEVAEREKKVDLPEGKGAILLKFGDDARATIMPKIEDISFTVAVSADGNIYEVSGSNMSKDIAETVPIILEEGTYSILVFGYQGTTDIASYKGEAKDQLVTPGATKNVTVSLEGNIVSTAYGTLTYNITLPDDTLAATMKIEPHSISPEGTPSQEINLLTPLSNRSNLTPGISLKSGYYEVTVTYSGTNAYRENVITWILHIYPNQKSHFECTNLPSLVKTNLTVTFNANGGELGDVAEYTNVQAGSIIPEPLEPTQSGKKFLTWHKNDPDCHEINRWVFPVAKVWEDFTLYANWDDEDPGEILVIDDDDWIDTGGGGINIYVVGESLRRIMEADPDSYIIFEIEFLKDVDASPTSGTRHILTGQFGTLIASKGEHMALGTVGSWRDLKMPELYNHPFINLEFPEKDDLPDVDGMLELKNYSPPDTAFLVLYVGIIQQGQGEHTFKDYYEGNVNEWNVMRELLIQVQFTEYIKLNRTLKLIEH